MAVHTEKTFEEAIEAHLLGPGGWQKGQPGEFERTQALFPKEFLAFVKASQ